MKTAFLALLAILVLGGAAGGAYFYFGQPAMASIGETKEHQEAKDVHPSKNLNNKDFKFVELDPLILPIVDGNGVSQVVSMIVVIEVDGEKNQSKVNGLQPLLKDAYIQELYGVLNRHAALQGGVLQVGMIKDRLHKISNRVLGDGVVEDVLLQAVQQHPI